MSQKSSEEWKNSIEGISDSLSQFGDEVRDDNYTGMVCKVLQQLPKSIRQKILEEVHFIIVGKALYGTVFQMNLLPSEKETILYFIILNFGAMVKLTEKETMFTIAHEIAHHILGHYPGSSDPDSEKKADFLAEKWGFKKPSDKIIESVIPLDKIKIPCFICKTYFIPSKQSHVFVDSFDRKLELPVCSTCFRNLVNFGVTTMNTRWIEYAKRA